MIRTSRFSAVYFALVLLAAAATSAVAAPNAQDWLRAMSQASQDLTYRGTFVYLHDGRLEAVRIIHRAAEGDEQERMIALTGEAREVIRDNERVTCILPKSKAVMVGRSIPRKPFPSALPRDLDALTDNYEFLAMGEDRVSGLPSRIVLIRPRDAFRYGYRLWLDRDNSLLLKSDLIDAEGRAVEQMMFTDMQVMDEVPAEDLEPALGGEGYTVIGHADQTAATDDAAPIHSDWAVADLPAGFMVTHHNRHSMPSAEGDVEHLVLSDGLATVSVYIEPQSPEHEGPSGLSSMGAVHALGVRRGDYQITVVGEVPRLTVERIEQSVQHRP
jgi:sigma-E factor negative regulatory protein RseB